MSGTLRSGIASTAQTFLALTCSPNNRLMIDFGVVKGFNTGALDYALFSGFVIPVAKLFWCENLFELRISQCHLSPVVSDVMAKND